MKMATGEQQAEPCNSDASAQLACPQPEAIAVEPYNGGHSYCTVPPGLHCMRALCVLNQIGESESSGAVSQRWPYLCDCCRSAAQGAKQKRLPAWRHHWKLLRQTKSQLRFKKLQSKWTSLLLLCKSLTWYGDCAQLHYVDACSNGQQESWNSSQLVLHEST